MQRAIPSSTSVRGAWRAICSSSARCSAISRWACLTWVVSTPITRIPVTLPSASRRGS